MAGMSSDPRLDGWPKMADFPQTEAGWNQYANAWAMRRRKAGSMGNVPMASVEEHRSAMALGREHGWQERGPE